jgi:predicted GIY-YIG superfamily endonuclease
VAHNANNVVVIVDDDDDGGGEEENEEEVEEEEDDGVGKDQDQEEGIAEAEVEEENKTDGQTSEEEGAVPAKCQWVCYTLLSQAEHRAAAATEVEHRAAAATGLRNSRCTSQLTYVGVTPNLRRRVRQHNGEIVGGAKYTKKGKGTWQVAYVIRGFQTHRQVLQFEWALKHKHAGMDAGGVDRSSEKKVAGSRCKRKRGGGSRRAPGRGINGRIDNLLRVINLPQWTTAAPPADQVPLVLEWWQRCWRPSNFASRLPPHVREANPEETHAQPVPP